MQTDPDKYGTIDEPLDEEFINDIDLVFGDVDEMFGYTIDEGYDF